MTTREIHAAPAALALAWACAYASTAPAAPRAPPACNAQSDQPAAFDELMRLLATRRHGHVRFEEVHQIALLERPLESSGELVYEAPDHLEQRTLAPRVETLVLDHGVLTARRGSRTTTLPLREYPQVAPFVESMRATLAGDRAALEHLFRVGFTGDLAHWTLRLTPADSTLARAVKDIRIEGAREAIRTVEIRQNDGDRSVLTIGPEIPP